ncbi:MAG: class I SAM-dependent methyltransferase [Arcicella sp.]|nr:class I SAM-dependent methyltransferase [Arcicella sp.]
MTNELTTRQFWIDYWESKENLVFEVPNNYPFVRLLEKLVEQNNSKTLLEIGGFPGYFSVWAKRHLHINATLLDFVVHTKILNDLETKNNLKTNSIEVIEVDLFNYTPEKKYDLVVSNGLIEHFIDTKNIIQKHVEQLNTDGILLITLPNFKSLNGWFQKTFDKENYDKHNINCMDLNLLHKICQELGLSEIQTRYDGKFMLWFERENDKPLWVKFFKKAIWLPLKVFFKIIPIETKSFSPYIIITAKKP